MGKPVDLILGSIRNLETDRLAGWRAFHLLDTQLEKCREDLKLSIAENNRLKSIIKKLRRNKK